MVDEQANGKKSFNPTGISQQFGLSLDQASDLIGILHHRGEVSGTGGDYRWAFCTLTPKGLESATKPVQPNQPPLPAITVGAGAIVNLAMNTGGNVNQQISKGVSQAKAIAALEKLLAQVDTVVPSDQREGAKATLHTAIGAAKQGRMELVKSLLPLLPPTIQTAAAWLQLTTALVGAQ